MPDPRRVRYWLRRRIGYGNLRAPFWFIGMEESCNDALAELDARLEGGAVDDLWDAHLRLAPTFDRLFGPRPALQPTWRPLIATLLAAAGHTYTTEAAREYQRHHLGRSADDSLLAELLPLPSPGVAFWPYAALDDLPELQSRAAYIAAWRPRRVAWLSRVIRAARPRAVVAYGTTYREHYRELLPGADWLDIVGGWAEGAVLGTGEERVIAAITPHPRARGSTNAHWRGLGQWIAANARA